MHPARSPAQPWYRQFWPWFLVAIPTLTVVAGFITLFIAMNNPDPVVEDDYYKKGLAINESLERDRNAADRGLSGFMGIDLEGGSVKLELYGRTDEQRPVLRLLHATRANQDQQIELSSAGGQRWEGKIAPMSPGKWYIKVESGAENWRIDGVLVYPGELVARLAPNVR